MKWKTVRAEEYCDSVRDGTHDTPKPVERGYKLVTGKHIKNGQIDSTDAYYISEKDYKKINERSKVEKWDVLMSMIGNGLGRSSVVKNEPNYAIKNIALFKIGEEKKAKWLHYYLSSPQGQGLIYNSLQGSGQPFISLSFLRDLPIPLPTTTFLEKSVEILSCYDELIENNQKQIKLLEEAAQRLYKEWFVDLRFPGYEDVEIINGVPEGWSKELIGDVIGKIPRTKQIKIAEYLREGIIPIVDQSRDFIAGYSNDTEALVDIGIPVIVFGDHTRILKYIQFPFAKGADGTQLIVSNRDNMPQSLLYLSLIGVDLSNYHYARHFKYLKAESILVPSQGIADKFDNLVTPMLIQIQKLRDKCNKSSRARDSLLPRLMSGELEVRL